MTGPGKKAVREGSAHKRAAILDAACELFIADGFDRSSVDAIAARAGVSKRTIYDYFGDKQALLEAVVRETGQSLVDSVKQAIDERLDDTSDLEAALVAFCADIADSALGSADYAALTRLVATESAHLPRLMEEMVATEPENLLAKRFEELDREGLLIAPRPRLAADHLVALTFSTAFNNVRQGEPPDRAYLATTITEGVRAFLRAYGPRP